MNAHDSRDGGRHSCELAETQSEPAGRERRDSEYRARILAAARRLFEQNGVGAVNMYQIAQEAGIGQGTLYRRYEHVGEICSQLLMDGVDVFLAELERLTAQEDGSESALELLYGVIERLVYFIDDRVELLSSINAMYAGKKSFLPHERPITMRLQRIFAGLLARADRQGELAETDILLISNLLLAALAPEQYLYHRDKLGYSKARYLGGIRQLFIDGLRKA